MENYDNVTVNSKLYSYPPLFISLVSWYKDVQKGKYECQTQEIGVKDTVNKKMFRHEDTNNLFGFYKVINKTV